MMALQEAPGVVAVCKKFRTAGSSTTQQQLLRRGSDSSSSDGSDAESPRAQLSASAAAGSSPGGLWQQQATTSKDSGSLRAATAAGLQVEVDVVADDGLTWIGAWQSCDEKILQAPGLLSAPCCTLHASVGAGCR
jgi:hypothetical protein